jgi:hypothetical protein
MSELTSDENKWLKKLQRVLNECPSKRLGFYTIGDHDVFVFDKDKEHLLDGERDFCVMVDEHDAGLGILIFPSGVYSTAG